MTAPLRFNPGGWNFFCLQQHSQSSALRSGEVHVRELEMMATSYRFPAGHRLQLVLSGGYWPLAWPAASGGGVRVHPGTSVCLPILQVPPFVFPFFIDIDKTN